MAKEKAQESWHDIYTYPVTPESKLTHKDLVNLRLENTANHFETLILDYLKQKLPELPKYDQWRNGFEEDFKRKGLDPEGLRIGLKITDCGNWEKPLIVLEENGFFAIPYELKGRQQEINWSGIRPATHMEIIQNQEAAFERIDRLSDILQLKQSELVASEK